MRTQACCLESTCSACKTRPAREYCPGRVGADAKAYGQFKQENMPRRIALNPSDYFFYSHHRMMERRNEGGNIAIMTMDVENRIAPDQIRDLLRRALLTHPVLMAKLKISLLSGRPFWHLPVDPEKSATTAAAAAHRYEDLRDVNDWETQLETLCQDRYLGTHVNREAQVTFEHYDLPGDRSRFCLRWPHFVMDAAGALWFLSELSRLSEKPDSDWPSGLTRDGEPINVMRGIPLGERLRLFKHSFSAQRQHLEFKVRTLFCDKPPRFRDQRYLHRVWSGETLKRIKANAKACTPPGPALYARHLAACVICALHRIFEEQGVDSEAYLITMPNDILGLARSADDPNHRPLNGNYLVSPTLCGKRSLVDDKRALGEDLFAQFQAYHENNVPMMQWSMVWMASAAHAWFYQVLMRLPLGLEALSSGFSYYRENADPVRTLCGARITNLWGAGPLPTPPGWNPAFSLFEDKLNFGLTYSRPAITDDLAQRFADLIHAEALEED